MSFKHKFVCMKTAFFSFISLKMPSSGLAGTRLLFFKKVSYIFSFFSQSYSPKDSLKPQSLISNPLWGITVLPLKWSLKSAHFYLAYSKKTQSFVLDSHFINSFPLINFIHTARKKSPLKSNYACFFLESINDFFFWIQFQCPTVAPKTMHDMPPLTSPISLWATLPFSLYPSHNLH